MSLQIKMEDFDDDFGELYADLEVHRTSATDGVPDFARLYIEPEEDVGSDTKNQDAKLKEEFISDAMKVDSECGESTRSGGEDSESNGGKEVNDEYIGSDSEDDLNIVLNDEDYPRFPVAGPRNGGVVRGVNYDDDDGDAAIVLTEVSNLGKNGKCVDKLADKSELVNSNGLGAQNRNGLKSGYHSQFFHRKYAGRGSAFVNNIKANMSVGLVSYFSPFTKSGRNGYTSIQKQVSRSSHVARLCAAANPMMAQCGYGSYLPWHRSIFDVNIDVLEEKPWRIPGVDSTDYFNFGFDENTWKHYCASLEQLWHASVQTVVPVYESPKINQEAMSEQTEQAVSGSLHSPSLRCELPKGKAIQVEDSVGERQPSMDVRLPRSRDSDVVIQIKVLESSYGYSGSGNSNVHESSEEGEFTAGNNINIPSSVSKHGKELSQELLEDVKNSEDSYIEERDDPVPGVDNSEHQGQMEKHTEDTASEGELKEGVGSGTCTADQCLIESELSFGDQDLSLTSYSDSESENSVHVDSEIKHSPLRRQSEKPATDLKDSAPSYHKTPKNSSFNRKPEHMDYYSRNRCPMQQEWRPQSHRHEPGSKLHKYNENYNDVFSNRISGSRQFFNYGRKKEQLKDYGMYKRRDVSRYRDTEHSCHYDGEKVDDVVHTRYTKYSYREGRDSFRNNTNNHVEKNWDGREYVFGHTTVMADNDDTERDWCHAEKGYSGDELSPPSYRESRQLMSKYCSFPAKERDIQRRRTYEKPHFRDRNHDTDQWFNECGLDFIDKSYRITTIEREMDSLDSNYEQQFLHIDRELKRSARRGRHRARPPLDLNSLWPGRMEDECQEYTHPQTLNLQCYRQSYPDSQKNSMYDTRINENLRGCRRHKDARDGRGSEWYYDNIDATNNEDFIIHPAKDCELEWRRYRSSSNFLDWTEDDIIFRHQDTLHAEEMTFSYEETSWHKGIHARYESLHDEMEVDDIQLQQHRLHMPRRDSDNCIKRTYNIICRDKRGQAKLKCRNSVDLVKGKGKSHGRSSRTRSVMCNGRLENSDQGIVKKRTASMGFNKSRIEKATHSESDHNCRKWLQNIPEKRLKEGLDVEEGQRVTEEPYLVSSKSRRDVSERAALTGSVGKRMLHGENNSDWDNNIGGYDSQRILETLAKMEKRRERFKEPIATKSETEKSLKVNDDLIVDTDETKQHRPARKRRWGGS